MNKVAVLSMIACLAGCASDSGVVDLGNENYVISKQAPSSFSGTGKIKSEAYSEASETCKRKGLSVVDSNMETSRPPYLFGNYPTVELKFTCG